MGGKTRAGLELSTRAFRRLEKTGKLFRRGAIFSMAERHCFASKTENSGGLLRVSYTREKEQDTNWCPVLFGAGKRT